MFFGGLRKELFWVLGAVAVVGIIVFIFFSEDILKGYAFERIRIWLKLLNGQDLTTEEARGSGWQSLQSLYAIGSGGLFGLGFGNSKQKHMYLPEPQNDFVFAVVCEELGFIGAVLIILLSSFSLAEDLLSVCVPKQSTVQCLLWASASR